MTDHFLSTDHAASRYGVPVLVNRETGIAYGPSDLIQTGNEGVFARIEGPRTAADHVRWLLERHFANDSEQTALAHKFLGR